MGGKTGGSILAGKRLDSIFGFEPPEVEGLCSCAIWYPTSPNGPDTGISSTGCSNPKCVLDGLLLLPVLSVLTLSASSLALPCGSYLLATLGIGGSTGGAAEFKLNPLFLAPAIPSLVPGLRKLSPLIRYGDCDLEGGRSKSKFICTGLTSGGGALLVGDERVLVAPELLRSCPLRPRAFANISSARPKAPPIPRSLGVSQSLQSVG